MVTTRSAGRRQSEVYHDAELVRLERTKDESATPNRTWGRSARARAIGNPRRPKQHANRDEETLEEAPKINRARRSKQENGHLEPKGELAGGKLGKGYLNTSSLLSIVVLLFSFVLYCLFDDGVTQSVCSFMFSTNIWSSLIPLQAMGILNFKVLNGTHSAQLSYKNQSKILDLQDIVLQELEEICEAPLETSVDYITPGEKVTTKITDGAKKLTESLQENVYPILKDVTGFGSKSIRMIKDGLAHPSILGPYIEEEYRFLNPDPFRRRVAYKLYKSVEHMPIMCGFSSINPALFSENVVNGVQAFGNPSEIFITSNNDVLKLLHSQRILNMTDISGETFLEIEPTAMWQILADNFHAFLGTPSRMWIEQTLENVFDIHETLHSESAQRIYTEIYEKLDSLDYAPAELLHSFGIELLSTTYPATSNLSVFMTEEGKQGPLKPIFMPDVLFNLKDAEWKTHVQKLADATSIKINSYNSFIQAIRLRRRQFKEFGAVATFHETLVPKAENSPLPELEALFAAALSGRSSARDTKIFESHMLMEMARMSTEDGLVMQLHTGLQRNYQKGDSTVMEVGIPFSVDFANGLQSLLHDYGNHPNLTLVLHTLDESTYSRELAPLALHYQSVKLGSPLWFHQNPEGIHRFLDSVLGSSGVMNIAGYADNSNHFLEIPSRHKVWRKLISDWVAKLVVEGRVKEADAYDLAYFLTYDLTKMTYRL